MVSRLRGCARRSLAIAFPNSISSVPSLILGSSRSQALRALIALTFSPLCAASARQCCFSGGSFASASISQPLSSEVPTPRSAMRFWKMQLR